MARNKPYPTPQRGSYVDDLHHKPLEQARNAINKSTASFLGGDQSTNMDQRQAWALFFGKFSAGDKPYTDNLERTHLDWPEQFPSGRAPFVETIILNKITAEEAWPLTELASWEGWHDGLEIHWIQLTFNRSPLALEPEEGIARLLTSSADRDQATMQRYGIGLVMEMGFYKTKRGQMYYYSNLAQIGSACLDTACAGVLNQVYRTNAGRLPKTQKLERLHTEEDVNAAVDQAVADFGCVVKQAYPLQYIIERCNRVTRTSVKQRDANFFVVPEEIHSIIGRMPQENIYLYSGRVRTRDTYSITKRLEGGTTFRSVTANYGDEEGMRNIPISYVEVGQVAPLTRRMVASVVDDLQHFNTKMMNMMIFSFPANQFVELIYAEHVFKMGLFDRSREHWPLTELGAKFFQGSNINVAEWIESSGSTQSLMRAAQKLKLLTPQAKLEFVRKFVAPGSQAHARLKEDVKDGNKALADEAENVFQWSKGLIGEYNKRTNAKASFIDPDKWDEFLRALGANLDHSLSLDGSSSQNADNKSEEPSGDRTTTWNSLLRKVAEVFQGVHVKDRHGYAGTVIEFIVGATRMILGDDELNKNGVNLTELFTKDRLFTDKGVNSILTNVREEASIVDIGKEINFALPAEDDGKRQDIPASALKAIRKCVTQMSQLSAGSGGWGNGDMRQRINRLKDTLALLNKKNIHLPAEWEKMIGNLSPPDPDDESGDAEDYDVNAGMGNSGSKQGNQGDAGDDKSAKPASAKPASHGEFDVGWFAAQEKARERNLQAVRKAKDAKVAREIDNDLALFHPQSAQMQAAAVVMRRFKKLFSTFPAALLAIYRKWVASRYNGTRGKDGKAAPWTEEQFQFIMQLIEHAYENEKKAASGIQNADEAERRASEAERALYPLLVEIYGGAILGDFGREAIGREDKGQPKPPGIGLVKWAAITSTTFAEMQRDNAGTLNTLTSGITTTASMLLVMQDMLGLAYQKVVTNLRPGVFLDYASHFNERSLSGKDRLGAYKKASSAAEQMHDDTETSASSNPEKRRMERLEQYPTDYWVLALQAASINGELVQWWLDNNMPPLFYWGFARPNICMRMGTIAGTIGGGEVFRCFYGNPDFQLAGNVTQKMIYGHFNIYIGPICMAPGCTGYVHHAVPCGGVVYGGGVECFDPLHAQDIEDYNEGRFEGDGNGGTKSAWVFPIRENETDNFQHVDMTGTFDKRFIPQNMTFQRSCPLSFLPILAEHIGIEKPSEAPWSSRFGVTDASEADRNTFMRKATFVTWLDRGKGTGELRAQQVGNDVFGPRQYNGMKDVWEGRNGTLVMTNGGMQPAAISILT